jgi:LysR family nitrogen assimilation transcriptional regulator
MEIRQLEAFIHVAELGSFSRAATILDTTQPALSRLVRQLEAEVRHSLLYRTGRGVALTEAGGLLLAHAKGITEQAKRARQDMDELHGTVNGHFNLGLSPSVARLTTIEFVRRFDATFPGASVSLSDGLPTNLSEWLLMGRIDAAVLYDTGHTTLIEKRLLLEEELFLIGKSTGEKTLVDSVPFRNIYQHPLIIPGRQQAIRHSVETQAAEFGVKLRIAMEIDAVYSILDLVSEGYGCAVLPARAVASDPRRRHFTMTHLTDPTPTTHLVMGTSARHPLSRLAADALALFEREVLPLYLGACR